MLNYLARLGWSHGDEELFSASRWSSGSTAATWRKSPAQWDAAKLRWVNAQHLKALADDALARAGRGRSCARRGIVAGDDAALLRACCALFKDRCDTTVELADWLRDATSPTSTPSAEDAGAARHRAVAPGAARRWPTSSQTVEWNKAGDRRGDQGDAGRATA